MNDEILEELRKEYADRRRTDSAVDQEHLLTALKRCRGLDSLLDERRNLIFGGMRGILNGQRKSVDLVSGMNTLNERIRTVLTENGLPADFLEPVYQCRSCKDTGYVGENVRDLCPCMKSEYQKRLYGKLGLKSQEVQTFETFSEKLLPDQILQGKKYSQRTLMQAAKARCENWSDSWPDTKIHTIVISGHSGLGKTFLLNAIAARLVERGMTPLSISAYRFMELARNAYFERGPEMDELISADVLLLDDLGCEPLMENITITQLVNLLNERQSQGRATVISTNLDTAEMKKRYTERIVSRLSDREHCVYYQLEGEDLRKRKGVSR